MWPTVYQVRRHAAHVILYISLNRHYSINIAQQYEPTCATNCVLPYNPWGYGAIGLTYHNDHFQAAVGSITFPRAIVADIVTSSPHERQRLVLTDQPPWGRDMRGLFSGYEPILEAYQDGGGYHDYQSIQEHLNAHSTIKAGLNYPPAPPPCEAISQGVNFPGFSGDPYPTVRRLSPADVVCEQQISSTDTCPEDNL